jgi:hypothetical protein
MATHPGSAVAPPPRRARRQPGRAGPVLVLGAAVLLAHAWLAALLAPGAPRAGLPQGAPVLLRSLPAPVAAPLAAPAVQPPAAADLPAAPSLRPTPIAPTANTRALTPRPVAPAQAPAMTAAASTPPDADPGAPAQAAPHAAVTDPLADAATATATDPAGEPPPLYATRVPPPVRLHYTLRHNGRAGSAVLAWQHDGSAYRLTLDAQGADGRPLIAQASTGGFDAHGLAPERFVDRRAGGRQRAANFQREVGPGSGRISYSGPGHTHPAWPGAQDRLSWLAQLAAILAAAGSPPDLLRLFVADATGQAGLWQLQRQADGDGTHWRREPPRPEGLRIDLWLAGPGDDHAGWPQRLRFTVPRSGDVLDLVRQPPP